MTDLASLHATVHGRVQGVFYRAFVVRHAQALKLAGYVRNLERGLVEIRAEGARKDLDKLLEHLRLGPPAARVENIVVEWSDYTGNYSGFGMRR